VTGAELVVVDRRGREMRDPRGATQLTQWQSTELPQIQPWDAGQAERYGRLANVIAYRCIQLRSRAAASVPLVAGRKLGDTKTINPNAAITKLLGPPPGGPAPKLSASKLLRWTFAQKITSGRRAWEIETDKAGRPVAFWPLVSAELREIPSQGGIDWFRVFEYGNVMNPVRFAPDQVFYGWEPSGLNFRQAESELQASRYDLSLVTLCDQYGVSFLRNNAVPAAIVTTTAFPNDEARRKFLSNWEGGYGGPNNAGRVALNEVGDDGDGPVGESIDVKVLGLSAKDARLIEARKAAMTEIAISLGTPWSKLDASGRTFDNAEAEDQDWWENTILPDLIDLQDDINMQLAPRLGDEVVWFDLRHVRALHRRITPITAPATAPQLVQSQLMWINEGRADYGLDPVEDGDRFMTAEEIAALKAGPAAAALVTGAADPALSEQPGAAALDEAKPLALPAPPKAGDPTLNAAEPAKGKLAKRGETRILDPEQQEVRRSIIWRQSDAAVRTLEARWERSWRRQFSKQLDATLARLTGKRGRQLLEKRDGEPAPLIDPAAVFDVEFWKAQAADSAGDLYDQVVSASLTALAARFGISFDVHAPWVEQFIEERVQQLAGQVTQTTYDSIRVEMTEGVRLGESIDDIAKRIRSVFSVASDVRATTIARTEVISAYNGAATQGAAALPADVVAGQEWIATRDARTRESHAAADGQVVAIGAPFDVGGHELAYPGDPNGGARNTVNCRCAVAFLTPDEFAAANGRSGKSLEVRVAVALAALVPVGAEGFDFISWRRAAEEVAA
jgi:HK97 family phage portal protein